MEVPRDEDSEDDSDDDENKNGDSASTEGIIAKAKEEAKKNGDEEETKVSTKTLGIKNWKKVILLSFFPLLIKILEQLAMLRTGY